ncbi:MAG: tetraacyldisaccharide 4'-kinase [Vampirovibrionales bacterium]
MMVPHLSLWQKSVKGLKHVKNTLELWLGQTMYRPFSAFAPNAQESAWWEKLFFWLVFLPSSFLYGFAMLAWHGYWQLYACMVSSYRLTKSPLILSIGNLTVGGTGKTPFTIALAQWLSTQGYRVVILTRGYRSTSHHQEGGQGMEASVPVLVTHPSQGDEAYLMATSLKPWQVPVLSGKHRLKGIQLATDHYHAQIILMDDAHQHRKAPRHLNLVLVGSPSRPWGNGLLLPAGPLREPVWMGLQRTDALLVSEETQATTKALSSVFKGRTTTFTLPKPHTVLTSVAHVPLSSDLLASPAFWANGTLVTAIARPERVLETYQVLAARATSQPIAPKAWVSYPDHYDYTPEELWSFFTQPDARVCTTEKDWVKWQVLLPEAYHVQVVLLKYELTLPKAFTEWLSPLLPSVTDATDKEPSLG